MVVLDMEESPVEQALIDRLKQSSLVLVNGNCHAKGMPDNFLYGCVPLEIKKTPLGEQPNMALFHREFMWLYSTDRQIRMQARSFHFEKELDHVGYVLSTVIHTFQEEAELAEKQMQSNAWLLSKTACEVATSRCERLSNLLSRTLAGLAEQMTPLEIRRFLRGFTDIRDYLEVLSFLKKKYMIIIAVKDTPGDMLSEEVVEAIRAMGFEHFQKGLWRMYAGVVQEDRIICDKSGLKTGASAECSYEDANMNLMVKSMAWRRGNKAQIVINDTDWSVNIRGLNIVVYDNASDTVLDSVGYDGHQLSSRFLRKNLS